MQSSPLPSRVAASPKHAPVLHVRQPKVGFVELGGAFPTEGRTVADVQANARYVGKELGRWRLSYSILYDRGADRLGLFEQIEHGRCSQHSSLLIALECMNQNATDENKDQIEKSLRMALPPLKIWVGAVIREERQFADWNRSLNESIKELCGTVLDLKLYEGLSEHHRKLTEIAYNFAKREIDSHENLVSLDEYMYWYNHPWGWLARWARQNPGLFARRLAELICVKPVKKAYKKMSRGPSSKHED